MSRRFCLHVRANKLQNTKGIWLPILYHELNKDDTILVQGWVRDQLSDNGSGTWHLWCESACGERIDIHKILLEMDENFYNLFYTTEKPERVDEDEEAIKMWELYEENPKDFWKKQDSPVRSFRSKISSLVKNKKY